jgi:hypothetical protein
MLLIDVMFLKQKSLQGAFSIYMKFIYAFRVDNYLNYNISSWHVLRRGKQED